jgi:hypothetical protein
MNDILKNADTADVDCKNGDFVVGESTFQHQQDLLSATEGEYKFDPLVGVGLAEFLDDEDPAEMMKKIRQQFSLDGMSIKTAKINKSGKLEIEANY